MHGHGEEAGGLFAELLLVGPGLVLIKVSVPACPDPGEESVGQHRPRTIKGVACTLLRGPDGRYCAKQSQIVPYQEVYRTAGVYWHR